MKKINVLLVDDHQIVRDGIKSLLTGSSNIEIIGEASDGAELLEKLKILYPDIIVLDISLPKTSGIELTKIITADYPEIKVLILSMYTNEDFIFNSIKAGAKGYLPKNTTRKELLEAIHQIYNGNEFFSETISAIILKSYIKKAKSDDDIATKKEVSLTGREIEILKLVVEGVTNTDIANKLFISIRTVESHKNHIMQKLELNTPVDLVKFAIKNKIIEI